MSAHGMRNRNEVCLVIELYYRKICNVDHATCPDQKFWWHECWV